MTCNRASFINACYCALSITFCVYLGEIVSTYIGGLPGSLYGMIIFTLLLKSKIVLSNRVADGIKWIIANMGVCFVPAGVGIIEHFELIKQHGLSIVLITIITTFLLLTFVGLAYQRLVLNKQITQ